MVLKKVKKSRGFTLIEMIVAAGIFSLISGSISGLFISGIHGQRRVLATQRLLDQTSFAMEYMSRSLRMANKDTGPVCLNALDSNYEITSTGDIGLRFINILENDDCQEFFLEGGKLKQKKNNLADTVDLTSDKIDVESFKIWLLGEEETDNTQPKVTLVLKIKSNEGREADRPSITIQTTISQRNLDVNEP